MPRIVEFIHHHPFLIAAAVIVILLIIGDEVLRRMRQYRQVAPTEGVLLINQGAAVLDIRAPGDFDKGHLIGAHNIPAAELDGRVAELEKFRDQPMLLCCDAGQTSQKAANVLIKHGFKAVNIIKGGIRAWQNENLPLERG